MKKILLLTALPIIILLSSCQNQNKDSVGTAKEQNKETAKESGIKKDAEFAVKAASGGMMEVELGNIAVNNASAQAVRDFGQGMVTDHSAANEELKSLAASKQIVLPTIPGDEHQARINKLKSMTGPEFDKAYIDLMVDDHKKDIDLFQKESDNGDDPEIKSWAGSKVPTLQHHLHMAEQIKDQLK